MSRLDYFKQESPRNWWFNGHNYLPGIYQELSGDEFEILVRWFKETGEINEIGEVQIPMMSFLLGMIDGNGIDKIVQLGHYMGYSTLLMGWKLKRMGIQHGLFSVDVNARATAFTKRYLDDAGLTEHVRLAVGDSIGLNMKNYAHDYLGADPKLVFIDSSHAYAHTVFELDYWFKALRPGGLIVLHDASTMGQDFDHTREGGVLRALEEWKDRNSSAETVILNRETQPYSAELNTLQDGCGMGIIQKAY